MGPHGVVSCWHFFLSFQSRSSVPDSRFLEMALHGFHGIRCREQRVQTPENGWLGSMKSPNLRVNFRPIFSGKKRGLVFSPFFSCFSIPLDSFMNPAKSLIWYSWNPKHPFISGCFNWMIPILYVGNGCFTKHPIKNGCLEYQV